jgi:putative cell wall-binding protein
MKINKSISLGLSLALILSNLSIVSYADTQPKIERYHGDDRYKTSIETAKTVTSDKVVFASGKNFADALSSTNIANKGSKLLLVEDETNVEPLLEGVKEVVIVGGNNILSEEFENKVKKQVSKVERLDGKDRYETNLKTLQYGEYKEVGVADGRNYPDALSATGFLKEKNQGLMLVDGSKNYTIPSETTVNYTFGGTISQEGGEAIKGADRYDTAIEIAKKSSYMNMALVSGDNFADALSATNIVYSKNAYIMLVPNLNKKELKALDKRIENIFIVGGLNSVSDSEVSDTIDMVNGRYTEEIELVISEPKIMTSDGYITVTIKNNSRSMIYYGSPIARYKILENGELGTIKQTYPGNIGSHAIMYSLKPKTDSTMKLNLHPDMYEYTKGDYLLKKEIEINGKTIYIQDTFSVE